MLMENKKLEHLDIGDNKIGDDGAGETCNGRTATNDTVTELRLYSCEISVEGNYCNL